MFHPQQKLQNKYHDLSFLAHAVLSRLQRLPAKVETHRACDQVVEADHQTSHNAVGALLATMDRVDQRRRQQQDDQNLQRIMRQNNKYTVILVEYCNYELVHIRAQYKHDNNQEQ